MPDENPIFDFAFYLARMDRVVLDENGTFAIVAGEPAQLPTPPIEQAGVLCVALLAVRPYTYDTDHVRIMPTEPLRITQAGLMTLRGLFRAKSKSAVVTRASAVELPASATALPK